MTAVSTLIGVVFGLAVLGWLSSRPDAPDGGSAVAKALRMIVHFFGWALIIGGFSGGILLIADALIADAFIAFDGVTVGVFGLILLGLTAAFYTAARHWLHF